MYGNIRRKSRSQAQQELSWEQQQWGGGQNSDTPPVKIGQTDVALLRNAIAIPDRLEGGCGRVLVGDQRLPGSGSIHGLKQHPVTGRWLLHRGGDLWLSAARAPRDWSLVSGLGQNGSLDATGEATVEVATFAGDAAANLSNPFVELSSTPPAAWNVVITEGSGGGFTIEIINPDTMSAVAEYTGNAGDQPIVGAEFTNLLGINLTCDIDGIPNSGYGTITGTLERVETDVDIDFSLRGLTESNTDGFSLWGRIVQNDDRTRTFRLYNDVSRVPSSLVASGTSPGVYYTGDEISGKSNDAPLSIVREYDISEVIFSPSASASIDGRSKIEFFQDYGFIVFVESSPPATIFVDQRTESFNFLSTSGGYPALPAADAGSGEYKRRYLQTFSRIVDPETGEPSSLLDRVSGEMVFEGPSNAASESTTDYCTGSSGNPIGGGGSVTLSLASASGPLVTANASSYITHVSIYGTVDVGENNPGGASEVYIWIADIPISSISYVDTTSDAVLLNRSAGGSTQGENFALRSRFFREMAKGIGGIRPDFMATVAPNSTEITYCDVQRYPRLVGYHFPAEQRLLTQDPVSEILTTKEMFVFMCPASNYTSVTSIAIDTGVAGISYIPSLQNFEKSSQTVGVKAGQRSFPVDENSFASLCVDGTIRIYSATSFGPSLDSDLVHKMIERAQPGAVIGFIRGALYIWYTEDSAATVTDKCLRYGFGGQAGNKWSEVVRENWVWPPVGGGGLAIYEDESAQLRMIAVDDEEGCLFAVEDLPPLRQYEDDEVEPAPSITGDAASQISDLVLPGWDGATLYGIIRDEGGGMRRLQIYESEADLQADVNVIGQTMPFSESAEGIEILGTMPGSVTVADVTPNTFTVVDGVAVSGKSQIVSPVRFRALRGARENFRCFHQMSSVHMRSPYGMPMPTVAAKWYADEALVPESASTSVPADGDIETFARVSGRTIQLELEMQSSGWQITGANTKYQTMDMQSDNGAWNGVDAQMQEEISTSLFSWVSSATGLVNRASPTLQRYAGMAPVPVDGPSSSQRGQMFLEPVYFAIEKSVVEFTIMFWVNGAVAGENAMDFAPVAMLDGDGLPLAYINFTDDGATADGGSFQYPLDPPVTEENGWQFVCLTYDGDGFSFYQNGSLVRFDVLSPGTELPIRSLRLGSPAGAQKIFDPRLREGALSAEAVAYYFSHPSQAP